MQQNSAESPSDFYTRIRTSVKRFFEAVNGPRPLEPSKADEEPDNAFTPSAKSDAAVKAFYTKTLSGKVTEEFEAFLASNSYITRNAEAFNARRNEDKAADEENLARHVAAIRAMMLDDLLHMFSHLLYKDIFDNTARSLILRTMQTGLRKQECRNEAFRYLKDPTLKVEHLLASMNATEFNLSRPATGNNHRLRVNAVSDTYTDDPPREEAHEGAASTTAHQTPPFALTPEQLSDLSASICAMVKSSQNTTRGGNRRGRGGRGGNRTNYNTDKQCNYCKRFNHVESECRTKQRELGPSEN